jgi:hypothetical protein
MREIFGAPVGSLAIVLILLVVLTVAAIAALAVRQAILLKLGVRNVGRRRAEIGRCSRHPDPRAGRRYPIPDRARGDGRGCRSRRDHRR